MTLSPCDGGTSNKADVSVRKSEDCRPPPPPVPNVSVPTDNSYASSWELPPVVNERIRSSLLMHEIVVSNVSTLPSSARDPGPQS